MWQVAIPAAASIIGGLLGHKGQKDTTETNIALGREQMAFQERMSNTSYQRGVEDMRKAGLNPMLAYSQGGASSPGGAMPQVQNAVGTGISSAVAGMSAVQSAQAVLQSKAQTENIAAMTEKVKSETLENSLHTANLAAQVRERTKHGDVLHESALKGVSEAVSARYEMERQQMRVEAERKHDTFDADSRRRKAEATLTELDINRSKAESEFYSGLGQANPYLAQLLGFIRAVTGAGSLLRGGK